MLLAFDAYNALRYGGDMYQDVLNDTAPLMIEMKWLVLFVVIILLGCGLVIAFIKFGSTKNDIRVSEGKDGIPRAIISIIAAFAFVSFLGIFYKIFSGFRF